MTILETVYASAPTSQVIISTLEIKHAAFSPIRICNDFADHEVTLETAEVVTFVQSGFDYSLPSKDTRGNQTLMFTIQNIDGVAQSSIDDALELGGQITVTYRAYLSTDLSAPAAAPITLTLVGATFERGAAQIECAFFDLLNTAWPRKRYTATFAPGLKYQ